MKTTCILAGLAFFVYATVQAQTDLRSLLKPAAAVQVTVPVNGT